MERSSVERAAGRFTPVRVAILATLLAAAWMAFNAWGNYEGHLSGLFYTGTHVALPQELATYRVNDPAGYDGQFYRLIAHDPLSRRGFDRYIDNPPLRWRRIGIPALAWLLAAGDDPAIDAAYLAVQLIFVLLGAFWLARFAESERLNPVWGLAFLLIPAVLVSLDRMTIDLPLAALTIGLVSRQNSRWPAYVFLCFAPLVRETGIVLLVAWILYSALERQWRKAVFAGICSIPALMWWAYVRAHTAPDETHWLAAYPFSGIVSASLESSAAGATLWLRTAWAFEKLALCGLLAAFVLSIYLILKHPLGFSEITACACTLFAAALGKPDIWDSAYAAGRTMSPLLIVLGMIALRDRRPIFAIPILLILPRIALQYEAQIMAAIRA
jgi:hypothetical protein